MFGRLIACALGVLCALTCIGGAAGAFTLLAQNWRDMSPKERYDAMQNYRQHQQLPADRQHDIEQQYEQWRQMPQDQRDRVRQNYQRFQQLPPQERERFERKYEKWRHHSQAPQ